MKFIRFILRFLLSLLISIGIVALILSFTDYSYLIKAVSSTYLEGESGPTIVDHSKFENRLVKADRHRPWNMDPKMDFNLTEEEEEVLEKWESTAFLLIKSDTIRLERYWEDFSSDSYSNSFSVAKSLVSVAIGAALQDGCIQSLDQKASEFLPELQNSELENITIRHLLQMSSGVDFGESYGDPFGFMAKTYYGKELKELTLSKQAIHPSGEVWKYQGGNTLILSFIIKEACGKNLSEFFSEKVWTKIGASKDALWTIAEKDGLEKAYCCFYSNARDFARIGKLMLQDGQWGNEQLLDTTYIKDAFKPVNLADESGEITKHYALQWWLADFEGVGVRYARGIQGQYIVFIPDWDVVLVRLGHKRDPEKGVKVPSDLYEYLAIAHRLYLESQ
ncbi:MAG: serine hydrolase [Flavobacteriales bacterium]|nr:serine hydrolase [Flavobacteriales bacterium]